MESATAFQYTSLYRKASIRILHLLPGNFDDPISCEIEHISLNEPPEYNALSYVWGDGKQTESISVFGHAFNITSNLARALRALRKPDVTFPVWADAICINQSDFVERSDQVGQMRTVYERAAQVFIWLGEESQWSELGITMIDKADTFPVEDWSNMIVEHKGEIDFVKMMIFGFQGLFEKPWWERLWTVQELAVATRDPLVGCGDKWFSWSQIERLNFEAYVSGKGEGFWIMMNVSGMGTIRDLVSIRNSVQNKENMGLARLIQTTARRKFAEPLDQIYALLGLTSPEVQHAIPIDYVKSLDQLYWEVARAYWRASKLVLPSWVPDWSGPYNQRHELLYHEGSYHTSRGFTAEVSFSNDLKTLTAAGLQLDSVLVIHDTEYDSSKPKIAIRELELTASAAAQGLIKDNSKRENALTDSFWRTLVANRTKSGEKAPDWWAEAPRVTKREADAPEDFLPDLDPVNRFAKFVVPFQTQVTYSMLSRRFFVTERGCFGLGPMNIERGDVVALIFGADMPMIVRQQGYQWILVGECYVHGYMDGEVLDIHYVEKKFPTVKFVLH